MDESPNKLCEATLKSRRKSFIMALLAIASARRVRMGQTSTLISKRLLNAATRWWRLGHSMWWHWQPSLQFMHSNTTSPSMTTIMRYPQKKSEEMAS